MWPPATPEPYDSNQLPSASKGSSPPPREESRGSQKISLPDPIPQLPDPAQYPDARFLYNHIQTSDIIALHSSMLPLMNTNTIASTNILGNTTPRFSSMG